MCSWPRARSSRASAIRAPASAAAADEPRPRFKGIELWIDSSALSLEGSRPASFVAWYAAWITRLFASGGSRSAPSPESRRMRRPRPPGTTRTIRSGPESAMPMASKPAPRFEVEHGTSTVNAFIGALPPGRRWSRVRLDPDARLHGSRGGQLRELLLGGGQGGLWRLVSHHDYLGQSLLAGLALDHAGHPHPVLRQNAGDLREHARLVLDREPEVAAGLHFGHREQLGPRAVLAGRRDGITQRQPAGHVHDLRQHGACGALPARR